MKKDFNVETSGLLLTDKDKTEKSPIGDALKKRLLKRKQTEYGLATSKDDEEEYSDTD